MVQDAAQNSQDARTRANAAKVFINSQYGGNEPPINARLPDFNINHVQVYMDIHIGTEG